MKRRVEVELEQLIPIIRELEEGGEYPKIKKFFAISIRTL